MDLGSSWKNTWRHEHGNISRNVSLKREKHGTECGSCYSHGLRSRDQVKGNEFVSPVTSVLSVSWLQPQCGYSYLLILLMSPLLCQKECCPLKLKAKINPFSLIYFFGDFWPHQEKSNSLPPPSQITFAFIFNPMFTGNNRPLCLCPEN